MMRGIAGSQVTALGIIEIHINMILDRFLCSLYQYEDFYSFVKSNQLYIKQIYWLLVCKPFCTFRYL